MENFNHIDAAIRGLQAGLHDLAIKVTFDAQANIQAQIRANEQVDTGFMLNSVYVRTSQGSTYRGGENALPEVDNPKDDFTGYVAVAASYAGYQNYGTVNMPARPFFEPGLEKTKASFEEASVLIEKKLHEVVG